MTAPPGLSRPPTSFIGPWYQGIHRPPLPTTPTHTTYQQTNHKHQDARVHYANLNPPPTHTPNQQHTPPAQAMPGTKTTTPQPPPGRTRPPGRTPPTGALVVPSEPQQGAHRRPRPDRPAPPHHPVFGVTGTRRGRPPPEPTRQCLRPASSPSTRCGPTRLCYPATIDREALPRKEVIQPHLPVRLPCYDFVPIASPTFDGSPPCGLGHRLRVLPTFVT